MPSTSSVVTISWMAPGGPLGELTAASYERAKALHAERKTLEEHARVAPVPPSMMDALRRDTVAVIAEVKRRSPSRGEINGALQTDTQAAAYASGGAAALSILTEPERFGGRLQDLADARRAVPLPLLRKDFVVDPLQILEARIAGASAVLLIARALPPSQLCDLADVARACALEPLIEVRDTTELSHAMDARARLVGVNHRDLETLVIDPETTRRVFPHIPSDIVAVAESGVTGRADVERLAAIGANAVLVGSSVSAASNPEAAVRALTGVKRYERGTH